MGKEGRGLGKKFEGGGGVRNVGGYHKMGGLETSANYELIQLQLIYKQNFNQLVIKYQHRTSKTYFSHVNGCRQTCQGVFS